MGPARAPSPVPFDGPGLRQRNQLLWEVPADSLVPDGFSTNNPRGGRALDRSALGRPVNVNDEVFRFPYIRSTGDPFSADNFDFEGNPRNNSRFGHLLPARLPRGIAVPALTEFALDMRYANDPVYALPHHLREATTKEHLEAGRIQRAWRRHRTRRQTRARAALHAIRGRPLTGKKRP